MDMHCIRRGTGKPLLLIHGIGGSSRSWQLILDALVEAGREVIAVDLPGHGATPALLGEVSIRTLADTVTSFLKEQDLLGIDAVGSSMGARLVLELARRGGIVGAVIALDPGGFWRAWEVPFFYYSVATSVRLVRFLQPVMPTLMGNSISRTALLTQFSAHPWQLPATLVDEEMRTFATAPSFDELLDQLAHGERQQGVLKGTIKHLLVIGWGRQDRVCFPGQAKRALAAFPDAHLHWFNDCGHFPQWDAPTETVHLVLAVIKGELITDSLPAPSTPLNHPSKVISKLAIGLMLIASISWLLRRKS